jgi:hypothetical protein
MARRFARSLQRAGIVGPVEVGKVGPLLGLFILLVVVPASPPLAPSRFGFLSAAGVFVVVIDLFLVPEGACKAPAAAGGVTPNDLPPFVFPMTVP